jgi:alkanesulfonate monooxygenase SsuD/methylene tetrahydromethanopterin reductase-like flavin-dependent oxidoreductase (luciferase family)
VARIGFAFVPQTPTQAVDLIGRADRAGVETVWTVMGAVGIDTLTLFAAAAGRPTASASAPPSSPPSPATPLALVTQAVALEGLAPGRLRLGIGTAHARTMVDVFGFDFSRPLAQLREYVGIVRPLLHTGAVDLEGAFYTARNVAIANAPGTPVLVSALRAPAFELAGELTDGAISWLCPPAYLQRVALPALAAGAARANRERPPLVAHVPVALSADRAAVYAAAKEHLASYAAAPFYARMFADAGHPLAADGAIPDGLLDALLVHGTPDEIVRGLRRRLAGGLDEVMVSLLPLTNRTLEEDALLELVAEVGRG